MVFCTCGGKAGETLAIMEKALAARGVKVEGSFQFSRRELGDAEKLGEFIDAVKKASGKT
jgi:hypothetical protein